MKSNPTPRDLGLTSDSFVGGFDTELMPRLIANVEGHQKTGKDHFCLTAPGPIVLFNFDRGVEGVVERFLSKKNITVAGIPLTKEEKRRGIKYPSYMFARPVPVGEEKRKGQQYLERVKELAYPIWERFISDLYEFYKSEARTGIIDTGGGAYSLARFAFHGMEKGKPDAKSDPYGAKSGDMKAIFQGLITDGQSYDKNVLWIHRLKEEWKGNEPTGKYRADGYNQAPFEMMVTLRTGKQRVRGKNVFSVEVMECRMDTTFEGERFEGSLCTFPIVASTLFGTGTEIWE